MKDERDNKEKKISTDLICKENEKRRKKEYCEGKEKERVKIKRKKNKNLVKKVKEEKSNKKKRSMNVLYLRRHWRQKYTNEEEKNALYKGKKKEKWTK